MKNIARDLALAALREVAGCKGFWQLQAVIHGKGLLNLRDPKRFSELVVARKLDPQHISLWSPLADKLEVRSFVKERVGEKYLAQLHVASTSPDEVYVCAGGLQQLGCVVKANHGSGFTQVLPPGQPPRSRDRSLWGYWMATNYGDLFCEPHYSPISPTLMVEEYLGRNGGELPIDYRIHCFSGVPRLIQVDVQQPHARGQSIFDTRWQRMPIQYGRSPTPASDSVPRPRGLQEMLDVAGVLSRGHPYVRVDLYDLDGRILFGELTFSPKGGVGRTSPHWLDDCLGDMVLGVEGETECLST